MISTCICPPPKIRLDDEQADALQGLPSHLLTVHLQLHHRLALSNCGSA
jgi:hypothetical protein